MFSLPAVRQGFSALRLEFMNTRIDKINQLLYHELSPIVQRYLPDEIISIISVQTSRDLSYAKVYVSVLGDKISPVNDLNRHSREIQAKLFKKLTLQKIPRIKFDLDNSASNYQKIEELLGNSQKS